MLRVGGQLYCADDDYPECDWTIFSSISRCSRDDLGNNCSCCYRERVTGSIGYCSIKSPFFNIHK